MQPIHLATLSWEDAEPRLAQDPILVLPLGATLKQHGPHLPLNTDWQLADHLASDLLDWTEAPANVLILPVLGFSHYPAFTEYPGSVSLSLETAAALISETIAWLGQHGARRCYVLNTGLSTARALGRAANDLSAREIALQWTDITTIAAPVETALQEQSEGSHADELETSMMLAINPSAVDMSRAVRDLAPGSGPFSRGPGPGRRHSPSGIYGDPTLATAAKGAAILAAWRKGIRGDINALAGLALPGQISQR